MDPAIAMLGADMVQLLKLALSKGGGLHSRAQEDSTVTVKRVWDWVSGGPGPWN